MTSLPSDKKDEFLTMLGELKGKLKAHFEILEFLGINDNGVASAREVYNRDIKECVMTADCMLAICDYTSSGLGYEMGTAVENRGIPVLAVGHEKINISRLIRGIDHENFQFHTYSSVSDLAEKTIKLLS